MVVHCHGGVGSPNREKDGMMGKFTVHWTIEEWYRVDIEADSRDEALEIFYAQSYLDGDVKHVGSELQDSVTVEETE
jgi:hypothetical protein